MKKLFTLIVIFALLVCFSGCRTLNRAENAIENQLDAAEDTIEQSVSNALLNPNSGTAELITPEQAQQIAMEHAGVTSQEVTGLFADLDRDDGRHEYDVEFHVGQLEYEYEIDAVTGKILSYDKDR